MAASPHRYLFALFSVLLAIILFSLLLTCTAQHHHGQSNAQDNAIIAILWLLALSNLFLSARLKQFRTAAHIICSAVLLILSVFALMTML